MVQQTTRLSEALAACRQLEHEIEELRADLTSLKSSKDDQHSSIADDQHSPQAPSRTTSLDIVHLLQQQQQMMSLLVSLVQPSNRRPTSLSDQPPPPDH